MKFWTDIHGPQRMNATNFGDPLAFHLMPPAGQHFHLSCKMSEHLLDGLDADIHDSQMMHPNNFGDPKIFI